MMIDDVDNGDDGVYDVDVRKFCTNPSSEAVRPILGTSMSSSYAR